MLRIMRWLMISSLGTISIVAQAAPQFGEITISPNIEHKITRTDDKQTLDILFTNLNVNAQGRQPRSQAVADMTLAVDNDTATLIRIDMHLGGDLTPGGTCVIASLLNGKLQRWQFRKRIADRLVLHTRTKAALPLRVSLWASCHANPEEPNSAATLGIDGISFVMAAN